MNRRSSGDSVFMVVRNILLCFALLAITACQSLDVEEETQEGQLLYPKPPETTRYRYVFELRRSTDIQDLSTMEKFRLLATDTTTQDVPFQKPMGVAARAGAIYISDSLLQLIHVYDIPQAKVFSNWPSSRRCIEKAVRNRR